jgi:alkylated DNA repair dioxygenase AlkB
MAQASLFSGPPYPSGFDYRPGFLSTSEERELLRDISQLEFTNVEMRGVVARRRTVHFGWTYGYYSRRAQPGPLLPAFLLPYRDRVGEWARVEPALFVEALVTEYPAGAPIGWHRDAPQFGHVIAGISLGSSARMKFRPYVSPSELPHARRETTHEVELEPRSAYLITDLARREFEHSIPPVASRRYSITFRLLR